VSLEHLLLGRRRRLEPEEARERVFRLAAAKADTKDPIHATER
jgi:hypothetical protein